MSATATTPEPVLDALAALYYLTGVAWDDIPDATRNIISSALADSAKVVYGPMPDDDNEIDAWDDGWRDALAARAEGLVQNENLLRGGRDAS